MQHNIALEVNEHDACKCWNRYSWKSNLSFKSLMTSDAYMRQQTNQHCRSSDYGLPPGRRQAIIWTHVGILLIGPFGTNFSEILIHENAFGNAIRKVAAICFGFNVLINNHTRGSRASLE